MPKIKAYKGNGLVIPVDEAKIGVAYKCPWTSKTFSTKRSYVTHLSKLRTSRMHARAKSIRLIKLKQDLWNQPDFDSVIEWISLHPEFMISNLGPRVSHIDPSNFSVEITYLKLQYADRVSNSHSCPRGGVTNFNSRSADRIGSPVPNGYPGWQGVIEYKISHDVGFGSDILKSTGIHTGTGGGRGNLSYGYDVKFFESDWPKIGDSFRQKKVFSTLAELSSNEWSEYIYGKPRYFTKW